MASIHFDESCNLIGQFGGPDFASAAVAGPGHYEIFNALQNKTKQNKTVKTLDFFKEM